MMQLTPLPAFDDNYIWMLDDGREALVVDPGEAAPVVQALTARDLTLAGILVTHHHGDHVGGLADLLPRLRGPLFATAHERMPVPVQGVTGGDHVRPMGLDFEVIDVPGHTAGHVAFFLPARDGQPPLLFCGDTLFSAGCGRLFEGTPAQMHASLSRLAALPAETRVCCAHEYTLSNLKFAAAVEPANADVAARIDWGRAQRAEGRPTLPSTLAVERLINPFLRCEEPAVVDAAVAEGAQDRGPVAVLAALREWKNRYR
jgi:hydroxyacylglutathione hydrolase